MLTTGESKEDYEKRRRTVNSLPKKSPLSECKIVKTKGRENLPFSSKCCKWKHRLGYFLMMCVLLRSR